MPTDNRKQSESSYSDDHADEFDSEESTSSEDNLGVPVRNVVTQAFFNSIIRKAPPNCKGKRFYTRAAFLTATRSYPRFGQLKPDPAAKREIAAFFAHVTHETGYACMHAALCYTEEIKKSRYCDPKAKQWPCAPGRQYYGRGPLQLTWNYNYGPCGRANRFDGLKNPDIVARNRVVAWKAALWFWMKNVRPVVGRGFGPTIRAINGALECNGKNPAAVKARVDFYRAYCKRFGVAPGPNLTC
ncbi:unnamed protein product [Linum tenue]|uniref:Glycoside hydrolase family 19 catalytic domain-containing protein n=1 Tax=Linum tenue TaxID=586396 RepID=A0AAV0PMV2_9ROSI|nr:unnamed protein product [Linum tenue]